MATKSKKKPSPEELLVEVKGQEAAKTYDFEDYILVIDELQKKDYSYSDIAKFLKDRLGFSATRGQVYRALKMWREQQEQADYANEEAADQYEHSGEPEDDYERDTGSVAVDVLNFLLEHHPEENLSTSHGDILRRAVALIEIDERNEREAAEADTQREQKKTEKKTNEPKK